MEIKEFIVTKKNGQRIAAKAYAPSMDGAKYPTVIFSHGFGGNYRDLEHHGETYADNGIACVFFDFCGGGLKSLSDGKMTDMTVVSEFLDLEEVAEAVSELSYVDSSKLFLHGESMGGLVSAYVASKNPGKYKGLILWYPAFVIPDDSKKRFAEGDNTVFGTKISPDFNITSKDIDISAIFKGYDGPVQIIHGDADGIAPIEYSHRAVKEYADADLLIIPGSDHGFSGEDNVRAITTSVEFVKNNA